MEDILEKYDFIDSKFRLALLSAKRAKQLVNGSRKKIDMIAENPLTIAIEEVYQGKIKYKILSEDEMERLNTNFYSVPVGDVVERDDLLYRNSTDSEDLDLDLDDRDEEEGDDEEDEDEEDEE